MTPTKKLPLFIVAGASGVGKSSACEILFQRETDYIVVMVDNSDLTPEQTASQIGRWIRERMERI